MRKCISLTVLLLASWTLAAQEKKEDTKKPDDPAPVVIKGQLPKGWKQLGLSDKQKKDVLTTRAKYAQKRAKLEEQLKALKAEEAEALEALLTTGQKERLKELKKN
jgi:hypothetical protein